MSNVAPLTAGIVMPPYQAGHSKTSPIPGTKVLLEGETGSGKSHAALSLMPAGIVPFVLMTDPSQVIIGKTKCPDLHYQYITPVSSSFEDMIVSSTRINQMTMDMLAKLQDPNRQKHRQFVQVLTALHNFTCDRCKVQFGDVTTWGTNRALYFDSLTGLNPMAMDLVAGDKPIKSQADWQMAQGQILKLVQSLCVNTHCHFIMTAHQEREMDEVTGAVKIMVSTLGKKLAPLIPRFFDEVIEAVREGDQFRWSTITINTVLKARLMPFNAKLAPTFTLLIDEWKKSGGVVE